MSRQSLPKVFRWKCLMNFARMFSNMFNRTVLQPHPPRVFCKNVFHDLSFKCVLPSSFLFAYVSPQYTPFPRHKVLLLWMCKPYQHNAPPILAHSQYTFHKIRFITTVYLFIYIYIHEVVEWTVWFTFKVFRIKKWEQTIAWLMTLDNTWALKVSHPESTIVLILSKRTDTLWPNSNSSISPLTAKTSSIDMLQHTDQGLLRKEFTIILSRICDFCSRMM
jgi:hypothetical protein